MVNILNERESEIMIFTLIALGQDSLFQLTDFGAIEVNERVINREVVVLAFATLTLKFYLLNLLSNIITERGSTQVTYSLNW